MSDTQITLSDVFSFTAGEVSSSQLKGIESSDNMLQSKEKIAKQAAIPNWSCIFREAIKNVDKLLDIKLVDIVISAWEQKGILRKYADLQKYSPDETVMVPLVEHTIKSVHKPSIEVLVNEKPLGKIDFNIDLALTLRGVTVKIRGGKIIEILTGSCVGKGTIKCENVLIFEKKTEPISLPGSITFGDGVSVI